MRRRRNRAAAVALTAVLGTVPMALPPAAHAADATEFGLPVPDVTPTGVAAASGGGAWFTEAQGGIGKITPSGRVTEYPVPRNGQKGTGYPDAMAVASDGAPWFTDSSGTVARVGRLDPATGKVSTYEPPADALPNAQITGIAPGADGAMWAATGSAGALLKITATGSAGVITTFATGLAPYSVAVGADQAVYFTDQGGQIGRLDPATGAVTTFAPPSAAGGYPALGEITAGKDGKLWFTESGSNKIGSLDPASGQISEYDVPTANARPAGLTVRPDGTVWFTESSASNLGMLDPASGQITEYPLPATLSAPFRLVSGADGKLWYTAPGRGRIGFVDPADPPSGFPHQATPPNGPGAPTMAAQFQNRCPQTICLTEVTTGGNTKIGSFALDLPAGAIRITGYLGDPDSTGLPVLKPPVSGQQFEGKPIDVPGGLIGQLPLVGPILGKTPAAMWAVNKLTVTQSLAGPVHVLAAPGGFGAQTTINIKLNNDLLGPNCVIGPVDAKLAPTFTGGGFGDDPQLGWVGGQMEINAPIAIPKAQGCGPFNILDGVINQMMGLPSPADKNSMNLTGILNLGVGINAANVPDALAPGSSNPLAAKLRALLAARSAKHASKPAVKIAKKHTYRVKARH
ncbi:Vgb family protein [Actinomadura rupiterrae]|uniref:Vgb family protein n=1 Tax=Actinomadura rupiterrae TaxID=559627 RepID=UPI0020A45BA5|nr:hypothetical protein [Actinomadura rupiterrae]MCP2340296.1 streptogramin lyase [Actinomadura rupiterrae]